ncbi:ATP-dependent helicase [Amycolatopsis acidiphila]|uniref:DNA 3'-5' helicase n=1 Tax=Amycolatopsis acidiphila TaxID=715473 RepID=A0A557ZTC8_9PSEU|nr:ATP-dependent DNA helicase [Amycolatopsis acidiphila]TVT15279.1 ATP-dependent helicase [Amycolatopsis acidiphila]UIJ61009.1 ATP-dependent helicase [Amycolatopsis acidiphila]GHG88806.1 DNA helicase [Amycolatopsis acidiphila]
MNARGTATRRARLVRRPVEPLRPQHWEPAARAVIERPGGFVRVLGGPGTGKTSLLATAVASRIDAGVDPERLLVLTTSRRAADALRADITRRVTSGLDGRTIREPIVRTVHSYAFALLRLQANAQGLPPPRLLSSPEQDVVVRELLAGDLELGAQDWPEQLRPALPVPGFAEELRDLILRAAERGLGPEDLVKLGKRTDRPQWVAAGVFWRQYEEVTILQGAGGAPALDAAELVASALVEMEGDAELLTREQARIRHVFVDDAQHLDHLQFRLIRLLGSAAADFVVAGDPDQAVFSFRGADPTLLADADPSGDHTITLTRAHRMSTEVHSAVTRLAGTLAGANRHRAFSPAPDAEYGAVRVRLLPTPSAEASWVADQLRRAHLTDGVPWSEMAVLVRSPGRSFPVLQRALRAAGVPIASAAEELPLAKQPAVRPLLAILRVATDPEVLDVDLAEMLLSSSLGGADPLGLRRMRRGLRRLELAGGGQRSSDELLLEVLRDNDKLAGLAAAEAAPIRRVGGLIAVTAAAIRRGAPVEQVLWELWKATELQPRLVRQSARGGTLGSQADRDLDAIVALFHAAGRYADRLPKASVAAFADYLSSQHIAGDSLAPVAARGEGVSLLTAHGAAGREWTVVAVAGVQEGSWPDLRLRGSLLGVERLVDLLSGVDNDVVSATAPILAEERRLFYVAASRARHTLLVSAVAGEDEQPSRFVDDIEPNSADESGIDSRMKPPGRSLVLAELVGELRKAVCDARTDPERRQLAARQLARLAEDGVPGAHPDSWYGVVDVSSDQPLYGSGDVVRISPSTVETLHKCPLRWLIERHGGSDPAQLAAITGTLVHGLAQAAASGMDDQQLREALDEAWAKVDAGAPWFSRRERNRVEQMVRNFLSWLETSRGELMQLGVEQDIEVELPVGEDGMLVRLRGRVDRLESDKEGRPVVVDLKTGKTPVSSADAELHPQLAAYQLSVLLGAFGDGKQPGGAKLVYLAKSNTRTGATQRAQQPLDEESGKRWLDLVREVAAAASGPGYQASENTDCDRCPARGSCPLRPEGRQVTGG